LRFVNQVADHAKQHKILIALEPTAIPETVFPLYLDGLAFCKELARPEVRLMADMAYFLRGNQPFDHIAKAPEMCLNCHIQGDKGQPGVGDMLKYHTRMFSIFKDIGYTRAVSCACPWIDTTGSGKMQFGIETAKTLKYLQNLRDKVYGS
jgi:sugar phosphate isomerase/epimerase